MLQVSKISAVSLLAAQTEVSSPKRIRGIHLFYHRCDGPKRISKLIYYHSAIYLRCNFFMSRCQASVASLATPTSYTTTHHFYPSAAR